MGLLLHGILPSAYTWFIFVGGSAPPDPDSLQVNDKVAHAIVFMGLALACGPLAGHGLMHRTSSRWRVSLLCAGYSALVGAALEVWQSRIPHRTADIWDWVADLVGALVAALVLSSILPWYVRWRTPALG